MGKLEEHWCSWCKVKLDKAKDQYVDFELINISVKGKKKKGIICQKCIDKDPELKKAFGKMIKAGNPTFLPVIECLQWPNCGTYEPVANKPIRCQHIAIIEDKLYCKRSHPGSIELIQEESELLRIKQKLLNEYINTLLNVDKMQELAKTDPQYAIVAQLFNADMIKKLFNKQQYIPPPKVVEQ